MKWRKPTTVITVFAVGGVCVSLAAATYYTLVVSLDSTSRPPTLIHDSPLTDVKFSRDDKLLAVAEMSGHLHVYDVATRSAICHLAQASNSIREVAFVHRDVLGIIIAHNRDDLELQLWDYGTGAAGLRSSRQLGETVYKAVFIRDGNQLVTLSSETPCGPKSILAITDIEKDKVIQSATISSNPGLRGLSPDGKFLATVDTGGVITLWRVQDLTRIARLDGGLGFKCLALASGGKSVALGYEDGTVRLIRMGTANKTVGVQCAGGEAVRVMSFSADASVLACGVAGPNVYLFSVQRQPTLLKTLIGRGFATHQVEFSHDGKLLAVGTWMRRGIDHKIFGTLELIDISTVVAASTACTPSNGAGSTTDAE